MGGSLFNLRSADGSSANNADEPSVLQLIMIKPINLRCEYLTNPLSIGVRNPRFSWVLESAEFNQTQSAYQIVVFDDARTLWDSGRVASADTAHIRYAGVPLQSRQCCMWRVTVWDGDGKSAESQPASFQLGLLESADWQANWITFDTDKFEMMGMQTPPYLRREFTLDVPVQRATLYISSRGLHTLHINGQRCHHTAMGSDWTDYTIRSIYDTIDVTDALGEGENALGVMLGDGWFSGYVGYKGARTVYGKTPQLLLQLEIEDVDGNVTTLVSDAQWKASDGAIRFSDMQMGETYDARLEQVGWDRVGFDDSGWSAVTIMPDGDIERTAQSAERVQIIEELTAQSVTEPEPKTFIYDFGRNFSGWAKLVVSAEIGTTVQLRYGEHINPDGTLYTWNLRKARAIDTYITKGDGVETWQPAFTYHGFRYVEVTGVDSAPVVTAMFVHSNLAQSGTFDSSNELVNQLWKNIYWGQRSNFVSVPTDCPQRDERLGWTGDVWVFGQTAVYNMDSAAFFTRWMETLIDAQFESGGFPDVAPKLSDTIEGAPGWSDAGIYLPYLLYRQYGDEQIIRDSWRAMAAQMAYIHAGNPDLLRTENVGRNYGDWVSHYADTPRDVLATALWAMVARMMGEMATVIGRDADASDYNELYDGIKAAFQAAYLADDGRVQGETQTCYAVALAADLIPDSLREAAVDHLVADIAQRDWHISTGFLGTPLLLPVLTDAGRADVAYRLLLQETLPSWGFMIRMGATSMWERWNSMLAENTFLDAENVAFVHPDIGLNLQMNSLNHYALGSVGEWLYRYMAGIEPAAAGFERVLIRPIIGGGLTHVSAEYDSIRGKITSAWRLAGDTLTLDITIPANTSAMVIVPAVDVSADAVQSLYESHGVTEIEVGSGRYQFVGTYKNAALP